MTNSDSDPTTDQSAGSGSESNPTAEFNEHTDSPIELVAGKYRLLEKIGEGGMGAVYRARQSEPIRREVAVKIILPGMDSQQVLARFEQERQALAMLDHPNIARVFDAGTTDRGQPFFAMELIKGFPITQFCNERKLSVRERLDLFVLVCHAVQHAHQKGIIHRDIKPSNILVALYDDKPVPKIIDFGVAKATTQQLTERTMFTQYGALVGTLEYMSPEQAQFNSLDIDTRTDIYSLGVLLYELLTGGTPFERKRLRSAAFDEMLRIIREEEPVTPSRRLSTTEEIASIAAQRNLEPRRLGTVVRGDLDWIVMKCLEKDRSRRYDTANSLAADLQRYLNDEPVSAGPPGAGYRLGKFLRRHRGPVIAAGLLVSAVVVGAAISISQAIRAMGAEKLAKSNEQTAIEQREAAVKATEGEKKAREIAERLAVKAAIEIDLKRMEDDLGVALLRLGSTLETIPSHLNPFRDVVVANILSWGQELCPLPALNHDGYDPIDARLNKSGSLVMTRGIGPNVRTWDPLSGSQFAVLKHRWPVDFAAFTNDGRSIVTYGDKERKVRVWNPETGVCRYTSPVHRGRIRLVAFSDDGDKIATVSDDVSKNGDDAAAHGAFGMLQVFDAKADRRLGQAFGDPAMEFGFVMDPRGRFLAAAVGDRTIRVYSTVDRIAARDLQRIRGNISGVSLSPSGRRLGLLVSTGDRAAFTCWETDHWAQTTQTEIPLGFDGAEWVDDATIALKDLGNQASETLLIEDPPKEVRRLYAVRRSGDLILGENGEVYDVQSGFLPPPRGRRYHPSAMDLAIDKRWLDRRPVVDFETELDLGGKSLDALAIVHTKREPIVVGLDVKTTKRTINRNSATSVPESFVEFVPMPSSIDDVELLTTYCRVVACGTLGANEKLVPDSRAAWEAERTKLVQRLDAAKGQLPSAVFRILDAVCQDRTYWVRRQIPTSDAATAAGLWRELLRLEPTWKNHLEFAFFRAPANRRATTDQLDHLASAWKLGGSQYLDVVFNPLIDALSDLVTSGAADPKGIQSAEEILRVLLGEVREGERRQRLVAVATMNAVRNKNLAEATKFSGEYERFVLRDGLQTFVDVFRKHEREIRGKGWDDYLATKQRACIARCLHGMVACLRKDRAAAEAALREADVLRKDLLELGRPEELHFQEAYDYAERLLKELKG